jgi:AraC-like DNA-binding protein
MINTAEELTASDCGRTIIYCIDRIKISNVIELVRIRKKFHNKIIICLQEIHPEYQTLLEELYFNNICYRELHCKKCFTEIEFSRELIKSLHLLINNKSYCYYTKKVFDKIKENGFKINLKSISTELGISLEHLTRAFKKDMGETYRDFICKLKYKVSVSLAEERKNEIPQVAAFLGFTEISNYYRFMKKARKNGKMDT